jgi:hypothetical protein
MYDPVFSNYYVNLIASGDVKSMFISSSSQPHLRHKQDSLNVALQSEMCSTDHAFPTLAVRATRPALS